MRGSLAGNADWAFLTRFRSRLLLAPVPEGLDRNTELKKHLTHWENGRFDDLVAHVAGQQASPTQRGVRAGHSQGAQSQTEEKLGKKARQQVASQAVSKAMKGLVGGVAAGTAQEREQWAADLIPRSGHSAPGGPFTTPDEAEAARRPAWGAGDVAAARAEMREAGRKPGSLPGIPWTHLAPLSAPGPSGDRQEHLDDCLAGAGVSHRRRLVRCLDDLTVAWATNTLPPVCRWMLNTQALFLVKEKEPSCKYFNDEEWLQAVPEADVAEVGPEMEVDTGSEQVPAADEGGLTDAAGAAPQAVDVERPAARPIQMGEFLRKWVGRRLLLLHGGDISRVMTAMRQLGVGAPGGAEALGVFQQLVFDLLKTGGLQRPLARVKIDEKNCFGSLEWPAIRAASQQALPRHHAVTCWKHAAVSEVEQRGVRPLPKNRGAEQGGVDGPLECSLTLGVVVCVARQNVHAAQRRGELPWSSSVAGAQEAVAEFDDRLSWTAAWEALAPEKRRQEEGTRAVIPDPRHEVQTAGGLPDFWYLDDGDVLCDPQC